LTGVQEPRPALNELLGKAIAYVAAFEQQLGGIVAEEHYTQRVVSGMEPSRRLRSEFLLVRGASDQPWVPFRDVISVNGRAVGDRERRLEDLFLAGGTGRVEAERISAESARYNVGSVVRTINIPTLALMFLGSAGALRSEFKVARADHVDGAPAWRLDFVERQRPTLIRAMLDDAPASGSFWIRAADGAVLKTRLVVPILRERGSETGRAQITTIYCRVPGVETLVPCSMDEVYKVSREEIRAFAVYSNIRRFQVSTEQQIK
jgi:hypothetical protein